MKRPWLIPVGGFLGAGKTTLILAAARVLGARGMKCAAILNDQGGDLVDSALAEAQGLAANQVTGGCFCCRFSDLMSAASALREISPDVIFLEPVGSCTDLSATILQPIKREFGGAYQLAPLSVVVDAGRALDDDNVRFLFEKQIAEADLVVYSKCDLHAPAITQLPNTRFVSPLSGDGVAAWLDEVMCGELPAGGKLLEIDYQRYAQAEAALGWLNWSATVRVAPALSPAALVGPWLDSVQESLRNAAAQIAHLKVFDQTPATYLKAALTSNSAEPDVEGDLTASPECEHVLRVNLRAVIDAEPLRELFLGTLERLPGARSNERLECFSPAPPNPERRYSEVVR